jgi:hypothetical protein
MAITLIHDCDVDRRDDPDTLNGDFRDTYLEELGAAFPHDGTQVAVGILVPGGKGSEYERRGLLLYDINAFIPASATITAARWWIYVMSTDAAPGHNFRLVRIRRHDWKENEATWNSYKTGSPWTSPGASDVNNDRDPMVTVGLGAITTVGWKNYDVLTLGSDAWTNRSGICTFIMERFDMFMAAQGEIMFHAKNYHPYGPETHHLRITYTLADRTFQVMVR